MAFGSFPTSSEIISPWKPDLLQIHTSPSDLDLQTPQSWDVSQQCSPQPCFITTPPPCRHNISAGGNTSPHSKKKPNLNLKKVIALVLVFFVSFLHQRRCRYHFFSPSLVFIHMIALKKNQNTMAIKTYLASYLAP